MKITGIKKLGIDRSRCILATVPTAAFVLCGAIITCCDSAIEQSGFMTRSGPTSSFISQRDQILRPVRSTGSVSGTLN